MPFFNIFRNLFGGSAPNEPKRDGFDNHHSHRHNFRNPIWQNGDDDDDDDDIGDFRHSGAHVVFSDPVEIMRHFESQMDQILKSFVFNFPQGERYINILPFEPHYQKKDNNLRDQMLKPDYDEPHDSVVPYDHDKNKVDIDLDGKVNEESLLEIWDKYKKSPSSLSPPTTFSIEPSVPQFHSIQKSVKVEVVRRSDGTVEHRKIIRDSEGNEETIISRQIGDKKHVMSIKKDKDGMKTKTEDLINMDEQELKNFDRQWEPTIRSDVGSRQSILNFLPWKQFFEPNPKL